MAHRPDAEIIQTTHNTARFFIENRAIGWIALVAVLAWGVWGYMKMPKRKDPDIPVRQAQVICRWAGITAEKIEQLVTRPIENKVAESNFLQPAGAGEDYGLKSLTVQGRSVVTLQMTDRLRDIKPPLNEINLKLQDVRLPKGAGPIQFNGDFGDTAGLMLTVASPREGEVAIALRAREIARSIAEARAKFPDQSGKRATAIICFPQSFTGLTTMGPALDLLGPFLTSAFGARDIVPIGGWGFVGLDAAMSGDESAMNAGVSRFFTERLGTAAIDPDFWPPVVVTDINNLEAKLTPIAGDKYTYRELDNFTDLLERGLAAAPQVSKVTRSGVLNQQINVEFSQTRLAQYGDVTNTLTEALAARNVTLPGGNIEVANTNFSLFPNGAFRDVSDVGSLVFGKSPSGSPVYLRDVADIWRGYVNPPSFLNFYTSRARAGRWDTNRAVTIALFMRSGDQIGQFGESVDRQLAILTRQLPGDLIIARTSDQPRQVKENIDMFMGALYEAIFLVVIVSLIGFREWRMALLIALAIPITLAMTFGMMHTLGADLQQVSIASLIIALGLLVDDPIVAGDGIKRDLDLGHPPIIAGWLGPTKLARAIMYATITNIVAYLPFALLGGDTGKFLAYLPYVITASLVASRLVSMTFIPMLGYYILRPAKELPPPIEERRHQGFSGYYYRFGTFCIEHRWKAFGASLGFLLLGVLVAKQLKTNFFPDDLQYFAYVDMTLSNSAALTATQDAVMKATKIIEDTAKRYGEQHPEHGEPRQVLKSVTSFIGAGGPRWWFSVSPESPQPNYAQMLIETYDKETTLDLVDELHETMPPQLPGVSVDVRKLQTNPVKNPVEVQISSLVDVDPAQQARNIRALRDLAAKVTGVFDSIPLTSQARDDWGREVFAADLDVDSDRANLSGLTNQDIADSTTAALTGAQVTTLLEGNKQIPVVMRLQRGDRGRLSDLNSLYVYGSSGQVKSPLAAVSAMVYKLKTEKMWRRDHFRTITVSAFPRVGVLPSELLNAARPGLKAIEEKLPPGYSFVLGGEYAKSKKGNSDMTTVLIISAAMIFVALTIQFNNLVKPWLVFAAVPFGAVGALMALYVMKTPFGFMGFLGVASLVGVIVSHVIVLFDFIEEMHEKGESLIESLLDAGIERLRPVLITVGAAVFALVPLAMHGGPMWQPLCYAQIGGLSVATVVELILVPVLYAIFILDLKIIKWESMEDHEKKTGVSTTLSATGGH